MRELKIGDYVRTKAGNIFKIIGGNEDNWDFDIGFGMLETFEENWLELFRYNDNGSFFDNKNIIKSSPNIIDLIEIGDYVNGYLVTMIDKDAYGEPIVFVGQRLIEESGYYKSYYNKNIKSIVTKELFNTVEYKEIV